MDKNINLQMPVMFEQLKNYKVGDMRFIPVKIWILHLEENLNGSYFSKEAVEKAIPSLANTPILTFIEENKEGENDFSDHRIVLERKGEDIKLSYKGSAIGVIPETNDAKLEDRLCDDGTTRTFLTCSGLIWKKWDDSTDILNRDLIKSQSMEISDNYSGFFNEKGYFEFQNFEFFGACALGDSVTPAMKNSTIEVNFAMNEIKAKLQQFSQFINQSSINEVDINNNEEGGNNVEENKEVTIEEVVETPVDEVVVEEIPTEEIVETVEEVVVEQELVEEPVNDFSVKFSDLQTQYDLLLKDFDSYKENYSVLNEEVEELRTYKNTKLTEERTIAEDSIFDSYEERIGNTTEFADLKANKVNFTLDALEKECVYIVGLHTEFTKETKKQEAAVKFSVEKETDEVKEVYGGLFTKYLNK